MMLMRIPLSLPILVAVVLNINFLTSEANVRRLTCTSECQQSDASGASGVALPPCVISTKRNCESDLNVPVDQAPGAPVQFSMNSSTYIGTDSGVYLDMSPHWQASPDRINLLTGYEVKIMCNRNICAEQYFCVTILFNRTLTVNDTSSNFSVTCQYGDFAQPNMDYVTIIRSLPNSNDNSNEGRFLTKLPSCKEESDLTVCTHESPEKWTPYWRPSATQLSNGSVVVTFWPSEDYSKYEIILESNYEQYTKTFITESQNLPSVLFNDVQNGTYRAYIMIHEDLCDECPMIASINTIAVEAMPTPAPSTTPPAPSTTPPAPSTTPPAPLTPPPAPLTPPPASLTPPPHPSTDSSTGSGPGSSLPWAALSGALGGILLVVLIVFLVACTCRRSPAPPCKSSNAEIEIGSDPTMSASPYGDCDSLNGTAYFNQFPLQNGTVYLDDPTCKFTSPSMAPATIHHDNLTNGRLLEESRLYANSMVSQQGDSISKVAVNIHCSTDHHTSSKCNQPQSPDSGVESIYSEGTLDDRLTVLSLNLPCYGGEV